MLRWYFIILTFVFVNNTILTFAFIFKECDETHWGDGCANECSCVNGVCDRTKGCVCDVGWQGADCLEDINECADTTLCGTNKECVNSDGSYICRCITGYIMNSNSVCIGR